MSAVRRVMSAVSGAAVVRYRVQIVPALGVIVGGVVAHVQAFQREIHRHVQFTSEAFGRRESL